MERIEILQGTNPLIAVKLKGVRLIPTFTEEVDGAEVTRHSYFTIRHSDSSFRPVEPNLGELQIQMDSLPTDAEWFAEDEYGNTLNINNGLVDSNGEYSMVEVHLNRAYTKLLHDHDYWFQFNLIDENKNMFAVDDKPIKLTVRTNLIDLRGTQNADS